MVNKPSVGELVRTGLSKALDLQHPIAVDNVSRLRRVHPTKTPAELVSYVDKVYLSAVTFTGFGAGAAAAIPNGWLQVPIAAADLLTFLEASVLYTLSVAEIHGLHTEDLERRRALVLTALIGNSASAAALAGVLDKTVPYWGKQIVKAVPREAIKAINKLLGPRFVTLYGSRQGVLVLGKQIPAFIGAGIGAAGNALFGRGVIEATKKLLGPAPKNWDTQESE
jgi:hypothetical protein